ncbi:MAG: 4'-phosphopantetheinyl transferase superfamily protein [Flavobacteriales bacterium]|nr:4'-phosphopantetheinyl transferase superfamily protein [Flavobacteriales bacterium]
MITIKYCKTEIVDPVSFSRLLAQLPKFMQEEVLWYKFSADRNSRLLGRLMLMSAIKESGGDEALIDTWQRDEHNKPFISGWNNFNISHSGDYVVLAYGEDSMGIDVEQNSKDLATDLLQYFHKNEQKYILNSTDKKSAFYYVWVRKEALLKATGIGIVNGLDQHSCLSDSISISGTSWNVKSIELDLGYFCSICFKGNHEICMEEYKGVEVVSF